MDVHDRFELVESVGRGAMGEVWRAIDRTTGEAVAVKILLQQDVQGRFVKEADLLATMTHPAIVRYVAHGPGYLAMEWIDGVDLETRLQSGPLTFEEASAIAERVSSALALAHAHGVIHRDLKPGNIFLPRGEAAKAKILDFGIALDAKRRVTLTGTIVGTPGYMAPEQVRGASVGPEADIFSLGCVLFECIVGKPAFDGPNILAILSKLVLDDPPRLTDIVSAPPNLAALVDRMLAKDRRLRPTAIEVERILAAHEIMETAPEALALGDRELTMISIILVGSPRLASAVTLGEDAERESFEAASHVLSFAGARLERIVGGAYTALINMGDVRDRAIRAAQCALALRTLHPTAPIAVVTGRGLAGERVPVGEAIDRATSSVARMTAGVHVDALTKDLLGDRFVVEGDLLVSETSAVAGTVLGRQTAFVGRDDDILALDVAASAWIEKGKGTAALVLGPPGTGKSRLMGEWLARLRMRRPDVAIWTAAADPMGAGSPLYLLRQAVRRACGIRAGDSDEAKAEHLHRFARGASDPHTLEALVGLDRAAALFEAARADGLMLAESMRRAFVEIVRAHTPLVIALEDLHWGDRASVAILEGALQTEAIFVVATARPELSSMFPSIFGESKTTIELERLSARASEKLVRSVLPSASPQAVEGIVTRAAGNVLLLEELIRAEGQPEIPETVLAMVHARIERLPQAARRVIRAASIFGDSFWEGGVRALASDIDVRAMIDQLITEEVFVSVAESRVENERELRFRHPLMREAGYRMLVDEDRRLGHRLASAWLEQAGIDDPLVLANHFEQGGMMERAGAAYLEAAGGAFAASDYASAIALGERGIRAGNARGRLLGELHLVMGDARHWSGDIDGALSDGRIAMDQFEAASSRWWEAAATVARALTRKAMKDDLAAMAVELEHVDPAKGAAASAARTLARIAFPLQLFGCDETVSHVVARAKKISLGVSDALLDAHLEQTNAARAMMTSDLEEATRAFEVAANAFERVGDERRAALAYANAGWTRFSLGDYENAKEKLERASSLAIRADLGSVDVTAKRMLAWVLFRLGDRPRALFLVRETKDKPISDLRMEGGTREYLADILLDNGEVDAAEEQARAGLALVLPHPALAPNMQSCLARALLAQGKAREALEHSQRAADHVESGNAIEGVETAVLFTHVRALNAVGNKVAAREALLRLRERIVNRATAIRDSRLRASFLERVPESVEVMRLCREWEVV